MRATSLPITRIRRSSSRQKSLAHSENGDYPTAEAYIGVNAAGEHVYWLSCEYCGHSYRYLQQHLTSRDVYAPARE